MGKNLKYTATKNTRAITTTNKIFTRSVINRNYKYKVE